MIAATSGRPDAMRQLMPAITSQTDPSMMSNINQAVVDATRDLTTFWRGGQPHGGLSRLALADAMADEPRSPTICMLENIISNLSSMIFHQ